MAQTKEELARKRNIYYTNNRKKILEASIKNYQKNKKAIISQRKKYFENNKEEILNKRKEYYKKNKELILEKKKEYVKKNKETILRKAREHGARTNWANQKNVNGKHDRNIRSLTGYYFPLDGQTCEVCNEEATERHHTTTPLQYDKFKYLCHDCHLEEHRTMKIKNIKQSEVQYA